MGPVSKLLGLIFNAIYTLFNGMGVESIALSIVVFTILIRLILFPFTLKQTRSSKIQNYLRPEFNKITKKYKGKKDQESMLAQQKETRELQEKYGIKMTQGCLTSILQFPVFIGLYNVIQNIPAYVPKVKAMYEPIATEIMKTDKGYNIISKFVEDNKVTRIASRLTEFASSTDATSGDGLKSFNSVIDILYRCNDDLLTKLTDVFSANPQVGRLIGESKDQIEAINHFIFGINLSEEPGFKLSPALIIPIAAFICQFLSMLVVPMNETGDPQQDAQMKSMRRSMYFMPFMSLFITIKAPAGLGIYWAVSALMGFLITVGINFYYDHIDMDKLVEKQMAKAAKDIEKRKASGKKTFMERMSESMMGEAEAEETKEKNKSMNKFGNMNLKNFESEVDNSNDSDDADSTDDASDNNSSASAPKKGSLADKANAVKRFNDTGVK